MSLYRDLTDDALQADLGKNSLKIFNTLLRQTLGYGKEFDRLTDKRLSQLSTVRLDRFRLSVHTVLEAGLFERQPSEKYQWRYSIATKYLEAHQAAFEKANPEASAKGKKAQFFPPFLPKNSTDSQKTAPISGNESHTALDLENFLSYIPPLLQLFTAANVAQNVPAMANGASIPNAMQPDLTQNIDKSIQSLADILKQGITELKNSLNPLINQSLHNQTAYTQSSPLSAYSPFQHGGLSVAKRSVGCGVEYNVSETASNPTPKAEPKKHSPRDQSPLTSLSEHQTETPPIPAEKQNIVRPPPENQPTAPATPENQPTPPSFPLVIELPTQLQNYAPNLHKALLPLDAHQQKQVLYVFNHMAAKGEIKKSASGLFIHLAKSALNGVLNLPEAPIHPAVAKAKAKALSDRCKPEGHPYADDPAIQWGYSPISNPLDTSNTPYQENNPYPYSPEEQEKIDDLVYEQRQSDKEAADRYMAHQAAQQREQEAQAKAAQCQPRSDSEHQASASRDLQILFAFLELGTQDYAGLLEEHDFAYLEDIYPNEIANYRKDLSTRRAECPF